jgi:hypothetical protein
MTARIVVGVFVSLAIGATAFAQNTPTLAETKTWLENDGAAMMGHNAQWSKDIRVPGQGRIISSQMYSSDKFTISEVSLESCVLSWSETHEHSSDNGAWNPVVRKTVVPLKDFKKAVVTKSYRTSNEPVFLVWIGTNQKTIQRSGPNPVLPTDGYGTLVQLAVSSEDGGKRIVNAIQHAVELCAAQKSPF